LIIILLGPKHDDDDAKAEVISTAALSFTSWNWCFLWDFIQDCYQESFWACIEHLPELKIAKISFFFPWCPERVAYDRVALTTGRASGILGGWANRAIVVGFWWFWQFWKALEKVDEECQGFRALATTLNNGNSIFERILGEN
jgi:hypothetical protein